MTRIALDELDERIIERLGHDARVSNREIGREFGLTEGTIRARVKRLLDNKVIRVAAVTNANRLRNPILAYLWVEADSASDIERVARALGALPEITFVATILGRADVLAMTLVENGAEADRFPPPDGGQDSRRPPRALQPRPEFHQARLSLVLASRLSGISR